MLHFFIGIPKVINFSLNGFYNNTVTLLLRTMNLFMGRIKNFQMIQNIYQKNSSKEVAYQSLGWNLEGCIPIFMENLKLGNISRSLSLNHKIPEDWLDTLFK